MRSRALSLVLVAWVALAPAGARQATTQAATIEGVVVDALGSQPIRGAIVRASLPPGVRSNAPAESAFRTGPDGRFILRVAAGAIGLQATKTGYLGAGSGAIDVPAGGRRGDVVLSLTPQALISGRVTDQLGDPAQSVTVRAVPRGDAARTGAAATTDDLGQYTIGGLDSGEFVVSVEGELNSVRSFATTYYPAAASARDATAVRAAAAEERTGVDVQLRFEPPAPRPQTGALFTQAANAGSIAGVVRDPSGRGLAQALVILTQSQGEPSARDTQSDEHGRFEFTNVPPGRLMLYANRLGYLATAAEGATSFQWTAVQLGPGQRVLDASITLTKAPVISGTLIDEFGDPVAGRVFVRGWDAAAMRRPASTDPKGRFRVPGLTPGDYVLSAEPEPAGRSLRMGDPSGGEQIAAMLPAYYPGVTDQSLAAPIAVRAGSETSALTLVVRPVPITAIDVTVDTGGRQVSNLKLMRLPIDDRWGGTSWSSPDGRRLDMVPAGRFMIVASGDEALENRGRRLWAVQEVSSDGVTPLSATLALQPGGRVSGRVTFEGNAQAPASISAMLLPAGPSFARTVTGGTDSSAPIEGDRFSIAGVLPGEYVVSVGEGASSWMVKSITMNGRDVLDEPIDIGPGSDTSLIVTFTDQLTEIAGIVADPGGRPATSTVVVAFPAEASRWREASLRTKMELSDDQGRYVIRGLPAGDYRVSVSPQAARGVLPTILPKLFNTATPVTIGPGEKRTVNLTVQR